MRFRLELSLHLGLLALEKVIFVSRHVPFSRQSRARRPLRVLASIFFATIPRETHVFVFSGDLFCECLARNGRFRLWAGAFLRQSRAKRLFLCVGKHFLAIVFSETAVFALDRGP